MSDVSVNTDAGNTYNLASRGFVKAIVSGHDHQTDAHSALFGALDARVANLEHATETAIKNPTAIEIRDEYGDIISRINADLTVDTPTSTKKLLTTDDYETLTQRDDLNTARIKTASEQIAVLADAFDRNTAEVETNFAEVRQSITEVSEEIHATDARLSDKVDIEIGKLTDTLNSHIDECNTEHENLISEVDGVKSSMATLTERVANVESIHNDDITRLEGDIANAVTGMQSSLNAVDAKIDENVERIDDKIVSLETADEALRGNVARIDEQITTLQVADAMTNTKISALQSGVSELVDVSNNFGERINNLESTDTDTDARINELANDISNLNIKDASIDGELNRIDSEIDLLQSNDASQDSRITALQSNVTNLNNSSNDYAGRITALESTDATHAALIDALDVKNNGQDEQIDALESTTNAISETLGEHSSAINSNAINIEQKQERLDISTNDFEYKGAEDNYKLSLRYGTVSPESTSAVKGSDVYAAVITLARDESRDEAAIVADTVVTDRLSTFTEDTSGAYVEATSGAYVDALATPVTKAVSGEVASAVNAEFAKFIPTISFVDWED